MITIKTKDEISSIKKGGALLARILRDLTKEVRAGVSTATLDHLAEEKIRAVGGEPSFKNYRPLGALRPFPASLCVSINDEVVHGIPSEKRIIKSGDVVSLDIGMWWPIGKIHTKSKKKVRPMATDTATTIVVGRTTPKISKLLQATKKSLILGIKELKPGGFIGDASSAIERVLAPTGYGIVRDLAGHGVGYKVHEDPFVPNYGPAGTGPVLKEGMVLALEPMATMGDWRVVLDSDDWTVRTRDRSIAAHFEHTVVITKKGVEIVTL
jgi:methionyl aminopeptidase